MRRKFVKIFILVIAAVIFVYFLRLSVQPLSSPPAPLPPGVGLGGESLSLRLPSSMKIGEERVEEVYIKVKLAVSLEEKSRGLSGILSLPENEGILFVFDKLYYYGFWMKDMNFPIDIIWLRPVPSGTGLRPALPDGRQVGDDSVELHLEVVYIKAAASPESFPEVFKPTVLAQYVLEVNAGLTDKHNLKVGDEIIVK